MASFNNLALTANGVKALLAAQSGTALTLSKIGMGSGTTTGSTVGLTSLVKPELILPISEKRIDSESGYMTIIAKMTNEDITEGFYWRETGLYFEDADGNDVLFAYACVSDKYDYVPAYSDQRYVKHIRIANIITDSADITVKVNEGLLYVDTLTFEEYKEHVEENYLPLKGGTLTGGLAVSNGLGAVHGYTGGSGRVLEIYASESDTDATVRRAVQIHSGMDIKDSVKLSDKKAGSSKEYNLYGEHNKDSMPFLPISGGMLTGYYLSLYNGCGALNCFDSNVLLASVNKSNGNNRQIRVYHDGSNDLINSVSLVNQINETISGYLLFGEHNKPRGSYTGNGSASSRQINIGGIGSFLLISGANIIAIVSEYGSISFNTAYNVVNCLNAESINFRNGVLTLATDDGGINYPSISYKYQLV